MKCPVCKRIVEQVYLGASIGASKLYGCPVCGVVVWDKLPQTDFRKSW